MITYTHFTTRKILKVYGEDAAAFLQSLLTQDVRTISSSRAVYTLILNPQGRFISELFVLLGQPQEYLLDVPQADAELILSIFTKYKLRSKVSFELTSCEVYGVTETKPLKTVALQEGAASDLIPLQASSTHALKQSATCSVLESSEAQELNSEIIATPAPQTLTEQLSTEGLSEQPRSGQDLESCAQSSQELSQFTTTANTSTPNSCKYAHACSLPPVSYLLCRAVGTSITLELSLQPEHHLTEASASSAHLAEVTSKKSWVWAYVDPRHKRLGVRIIVCKDLEGAQLITADELEESQPSQAKGSSAASPAGIFSAALGNQTLQPLTRVLAWASYLLVQDRKKAKYLDYLASQPHSIKIVPESHSYTPLRILLGCPTSAELEKEKAIPLECNFEELNALSFNKGCYLGQEFTNATKRVMQVRKKLVSIQLIPNLGQDILRNNTAYALREILCGNALTKGSKISYRSPGGGKPRKSWKVIAVCPCNTHEKVVLLQAYMEDIAKALQTSPYLILAQGNRTYLAVIYKAPWMDN